MVWTRTYPHAGATAGEERADLSEVVGQESPYMRLDRESTYTIFTEITLLM
jgi:hypothetical protein